MKYALITLITLTTMGAPDATAQKLPRSTPEKQGLSSTAVLNFVKAAEEKIDAAQLRAAAPRPGRRRGLVASL